MTNSDFTGNTPGQGSFRVTEAVDGWCVFVVFPEGGRFERFELSWDEAIEQLQSLGIIN